MRPGDSKLQRYEPEGHPVFITTSTFRKTPFFEGPENSQILSELIFTLKDEHNVKVLSFVIMPDHIHLIIFAEKQKEISKYIQAVKRRSARVINFNRKTTGSVWSHRYYDPILRSQQELANAVEYIHLNPVKAGLAMEAESFSFSSSNGRWKTDLEKFLAGEFHKPL